MKQTPEIGLAKTPETWTALVTAFVLVLVSLSYFMGYQAALHDVDASFDCAEGGAREAEGATGAAAGAVPLGNTGTTTVEGAQ